MGLKRPPQHRVDARPVYVSEGDEAWDHARIRSEIDKLEAQEKGLSATHPVVRYHSGQTRYDLRDALPYLDTSKAYQFVLTPLSRPQRSELRDIEERKGRHSAYERAADYGFVKCDGPPDAPASLDDVDREWPWMVEEIGVAVMLASQPLTEPEKKQSDS